MIALAISSSDRREARREMRVPCELKVEVTTGERTFRASLADLSTGGAYIASRSPLRPGTPLQLAFDVGATRAADGADTDSVEVAGAGFINFTLAPGSFHFLTGPSGSGWNRGRRAGSAMSGMAGRIMGSRVPTIGGAD